MEGTAKAASVHITAKQLAGLPVRGVAALAARGVLRLLPATGDAPPETLRDVAAGWAVVALYSLGGMDPGTAEAADAALAAPALQDVPAVFAASRIVQSSGDPGRAAADTAEALQASLRPLSEDIAEAARAAALADLGWLREWAGQKRAVDGIAGPDFHMRPLWLTADREQPPDSWWRVLEPWYSATERAGLGLIRELYERALKGGGIDREPLLAFLDDWYRDYRERQAPASEQVEVAQEAPADDQDAGEPAQPGQASTDPDAALLPGGIAVTAADTPAIEDHLGRTPLVHTLADMLAAPEQALPMTIALLGDWGAGKTSVIEQLKRRLNQLAELDRDQFGASGRHKRSQYLFATFNAWEYEQTDNLRAGLAQEVVNGLIADLSRWDKLVLAVTKAAKGNNLEFLMTLGGLLLVGIGVAFGVDLATPDEAEAVLKATGMLTGGGVLALSAYLLLQTWRTGRRLLEHPLATQLSTYLKLPSYGEHLGEVPVIKKEIRELCDERLNNITNGRLLVVVDDLDRCHPSAVIETLDAIRLVMNLDRVAVIIAVDDRIAFRAVADHYKDLEEEGRRSRWEIARDYLGKIIQLPVNLYDPWPSEVGDFVRSHLFQVSPEAEAAHGAAITEPPAPDAVTKVQPEPVAKPRLTKAAERLVRKQGVDAAVIPASGKDGCITHADVQRFLKAQREAPATEAPVEPAEIDNPELMEQQERLAVERKVVAEPSTEAERAEERAAVMEDTVEERELFAELTRDMGFNNPRQLIRLRNSYRLLKGYRHSRGSAMSWPLLSTLMHGLFWYEYLYQKRLAERQHAELVVWLWAAQPKWVEAADQRRRNPPPVRMAQRLHRLLPADEWGSEYGRLMRTVDLVVLPNAQMGLILDKPSADAVLAAQATDRALLPDPWGRGYVPMKSTAKSPA